MNEAERPGGGSNLSAAWRTAARPAAALGCIVAGLLVARFTRSIWLAGLLLLGLPLIWRTVVNLVRGRFAADVVATLAIVAALVLGQPLAGLVIVLMQTGGEALERFAAGRASRAVAQLEAEAPRTAHRVERDRTVDIPVDQIAIGDRLLVRPGEMIPCDGVVRSGTSSVDTARVTGEPLPRAAGSGTPLTSGMINLEGPLELEATATAATSLYHQIVELVRTAEASKAPIQRLADRAAVWFTPATIAVCLVTYLASTDPLRVLAVLVVATPCPLLLAAPVAMLGGINRAARHQIIVRHGGALESLARADIAVFDKTGTLTLGHPAVDRVTPLPPFTELDLLRLAGAVEAGSGHLLARTLTEAAEARVGKLPPAADVVESAGRGVTGEVEGRRVTIGALTLIAEWEREAAPVLERLEDGASLRAYVAIDHQPAGTVSYADRIRPTAAPAIRGLRQLGFDQVTILSGDRAANATAAGKPLGITQAVGDLRPQDKVAYVARLGKQGRRVLMVGDGANDAPALTAASVGVALAAHGGGISAEAADVVLLADDLTRVPEAVAIARHTMKIARQSIGVGLGLSGVAMIVAGFGFIPPTIGALLQEAIDAAVILNALRAMRPGSDEQRLHREA
jgi:heavy metal translocating P-type ATPase